MLSPDSTETPVLVKKEVVSDTLAVLYFTWMGGVTVIGWTAVVTSLDFFDFKYPHANVSFIFPIALYVAQLLNTALITKLSMIMSYNARILTSLLSIITATIALPIVGNMMPGTSFGIQLLMIILFFLGFNNTFCYASTGGLTSQLDGKYSAYLLIGIGVFNLMVVLLRELVFIIFHPESSEDYGCLLIYFGATASFLAMGIILHRLFMNSKFYKIKVLRKFSEDEALLSRQDSETLMKDSKPQRSFKTLLEVLRHNKGFICGLMLSCGQNNLVYPGVYLKKPMPDVDGSTKTLLMGVVYGVFFIVGKKLGQYRKYYNLTIVKLVLVFKFFLDAFCIIQAITIEIPVFNTIWFGYANLGMLGMSMGFVNVALFIMGPETVKGDKKEVAGFLSVFGMNFGLMAGSFLSLPLQNIGLKK